MSTRMSERSESREDEELGADLEKRRAEWKEKGGRPWAAVERDVKAKSYRPRPRSWGIGASGHTDTASKASDMRANRKSLFPLDGGRLRWG